MKINRKNTPLPAIAIIASAFVITLLILGLSYRDIRMEEKRVTDVLYREGITLMRSLEASIRTGMMMEVRREQLQLQLEESTQEPDIAYILLLDEHGEIIAKTGLEQTNPYEWINTKEFAKTGEAITRIKENPKIGKVFEIAKAFKPLRQGPRMQGMMDMHRRLMGRDMPQEIFNDRIIIIGLKMAELEQVQKEEKKRTLIIAAALLILATGAIYFVFLLQNYYLVNTALEDMKEKVRKTEGFVAVGRIAASIAHEIRNPLSSIKGFAQYFKFRFKAKKDAAYADIMIKEIDRLNRVITELLDYAKPTELNLKKQGLEEIISYSIKLLESDIKGKGINIKEEHEDSLPSVLIDKDQMTQAVLNILLNSIEAVDKNGEIRIDIRQIKGGLQLSIADNGKGIAKENVDKIFEPFFTTKKSGTGIGLALVKKIIDMHNGRIEVESREGEGARFIIRLPV
ncbi:MAG: ATP-binding protein [Nitrospirae bacterium]|nr:ATP-binding protein [Nitrospirota bacterium]